MMRQVEGGDDTFDALFKVVLVGDAGVGKTHLMNRYIKGVLPKNKMPTIGVEFATRIVPLQSDIKIKAQIWDTAGHERYRAMTAAHYRRAVGALLVYDITKALTFQNCQRWVTELKSMAEPDILIMLVGNKVDLVDEDESMRKVSINEAQKFAQENSLYFQESSAITCVNVKEVFEILLQEIYNEQSKGGMDRGGQNHHPLAPGRYVKKSGCICSQ